MNNFDFIDYDKRPVKVEMSKSTKQVLENEMQVEIPVTTPLDENTNINTTNNIIIEDATEVKEVLENVKKSKKVVAKKENGKVKLKQSLNG